MTNRQFALSDKTFRYSCDAVNLPATSRQASKFLRKKGRAYKDGLTDAKRRIAEEAERNLKNLGPQSPVAAPDEQG